MKRFPLIVIILLLLGLSGLVFVLARPQKQPPLSEEDPATPSPGEEVEGIRTEALFACAEEKGFMVAMQGNEAKIALDDGRFVPVERLPRADEAEGGAAGYQSADGKVRLIMNSGFATNAFLEEDGETTYSECTALAEGIAALEAAIGAGATGAGVRIVPLEVLQDSRCPIDVTCIQAGTLRVRALLTSGIGEPDGDGLSPSRGEAEQVFELGKAVTTEAEQVTLSSVLPATRSSEEIEPDDYRFYFSVVKRSGNE